MMADSSSTTGPQLGMVEETNEAYHAGPGYSKSHLDDFAISPFHYWARRRNPARPVREETDAMRLGTATHCAVLEPDLFAARYVTVPADAPRKPSVTQINAKKPSPETIVAIQWWTQFRNANTDREILDDDEYARCVAMRDAVHRHPVAAPLLRNGVSERSFYAKDPETGELVKCRIDYLSGVIVDLKTTASAGPSDFAKSVANYRYYVQQPWYQSVLELATGEAAPPFFFLAVEATYPHAIGVYRLAREDVQRGAQAMLRDFRKLLEHSAANYWPDYAEDVIELSLPSWRRASEDAISLF